MSLRVRIVLVFALPPILGVLLWTLGQEWQVRNNFLGYMRSMEAAQVANLARELAAVARAQDPLNTLEGSPERWRALLASAAIDVPRVHDHGNRPPGSAKALPLASRLSLWRDGKKILGPAMPANAIRVSITDGRRQWGELRYQALPFLRDDVYMAFAQAQRVQVLRGASIVLAVSLVVAWLLARGLLAPLQRLATAAQALRAGDFDVRVPATRGDELGALAHDFNRLAAVLAHNRAAQRAWIADISHELRTPLTVLRAELHALQEGIRPLSYEALASLDEEAQRLTHLVEDLYTLSTADTGALEYKFETLPLNDWLQSGLDRFASRFADAGLTARLCPDSSRVLAVVRGDRQRLGQVLDNLLMNSLRYTDRGGRVELAVHAEPEGWRIAIDDTAPGVAKADLPRLFERWFRVETSRSRATGGAGLGLSICRSIVEGHGGRIAARPSPLGGLGIDIRLPRAIGAL